MTDLDLEIAQLFLAGVPGTSLTEEWRESLQRFPFGGVHLSDWNLTGPEQAAALLEEIRTAIRESGVTDLPLMALDHEGGSLTPLRHGEATNLPGAMALGAMDDPAAVREIGRIMGRELASLGFNLNWAPVMDVNCNPRNPVIGIRSFGDEPRGVVAMGIAMIEGMQEGGVAATAKHFPGHGDTVIDSHHGLPVVEDDLARLEPLHLLPFAAAAAAGVDAIMTAHILFPKLAGSRLDPDGAHAHLPATLNPAILEGLLRRHLGFDGVIVTDALEMWGIQGQWEIPEAAVMALEAGADIPLIVFDHEARERAFAAVRQAVETGRISRERLARSVARVQALRERIAARRLEAGHSDRFDPAAHRRMVAEHQERVTALAHRGIWTSAPVEPIPAGSGLLVVTPVQENLTPADTTGGQPVSLAGELAGLGYRVQAISPSLEVDATEREAILEAARGGCDRVILGTINAWRFPGQVELVSALAGTGLPVICAALRDPTDLLHVPPGLPRLATCSTEPVMMRALAEVLAGRRTPEGRLPVRLPLQGG
ncbi:MAG: glycoside hydrolase family 3 N-terminal domain-containing protein [Bacillota bacterium]